MPWVYRNIKCGIKVRDKPCQQRENCFHTDVIGSTVFYSNLQTHNWPRSIYQYSNIGFRGFQVKIVNFLSFFCLSIPKRDLDTKKTAPNIEVWPESLGAMLEYVGCYTHK